MTGQHRVLLLTSTALLAAGCSSTVINVVKDGAPVQGATVWADGVKLGDTDAAGSLTTGSLKSGTRLVARSLIRTYTAYKNDHNGWADHTYLTSRSIGDDGMAADFMVTNPIGTQVLTLDRRNVLVGLHWVVALDWDASAGDLATVVTDIQGASPFLYNATDGQFFVEQVEIGDDGTFWQSSDYHVHVDSSVWPHSTASGGFLGSVWWGAPGIELGRCDSVVSSQNSKVNCTNSNVWIHEFGHLGFSLMDEYLGFGVAPPPPGANVGNNFCTGKFFGNDPVFAKNGPKASCLMFDDFNASKFCSQHHDNPHNAGTLQSFDSCWNSIASNYQDDQNPPRFTFRTPQSRSTIPGPVSPGLPTQWVPVINVTNNHRGTLCGPITVTTRFSSGAVATGQSVWLHSTKGDLSEGFTDPSTGTMTIVGAHLGETIVTPNQFIQVASSNCAPTT
jgi:hypothetical protein